MVFVFGIPEIVRLLVFVENLLFFSEQAGFFQSG